MMRMELEKRQQLSVIFNRYDVNQSNKLERDQVKNLLTDMDACAAGDGSFIQHVYKIFFDTTHSTHCSKFCSF